MGLELDVDGNLLESRDWRKRLLEWFIVRVNEQSSICDVQSYGGCKLEEILDKARELQDFHTMFHNSKVDNVHLDPIWLYNWTYENNLIMRATENLPQDVRSEDVILHYVAIFKDSISGCTDYDGGHVKGTLTDPCLNKDILECPHTVERTKRLCSRPAKLDNEYSPKPQNKSMKSRPKKIRVIKNMGRKSSDKSFQLAALKKKVGKKPMSVELDRQLWDWYSDCKSRGKKISVEVVRARARFVFDKAGHKNFKASEGWYRKWLRRWKVLEVSKEPKAIIQESQPVAEVEQEPAPDVHQFPVEISDSSYIAECSQQSTTITAEAPLGILESLRRQSTPSIQLSKDEVINRAVVETNSSTGLDFMDVDFSLTSRTSSDQVCLTSNFVSCLDATEISGLTLPSVGCCEDSRDRTIGSLNLTAETLDQLQEFMSVDRNRSPRNCIESDGDRRRGSLTRKRIKPGERYQDDFKLEVVNYATSKNSFKLAAKQYNVHHATVSQWCRDKQVSEDGSSNKIVEIKNSQRVEAPDKQLIDWILECRVTGVKLDAHLVRSKAEQLLGNHVEGELNVSYRWLSLWLKRWTEVTYEEGMEDLKMTPMKDRQIHYPLAFKEEITNNALLHGNSWTSRVFNVPLKRVSDWVALKDTRQRRAGRKVASGDAEKQIWEWYCDCREAGQRPKGSDVREKACQIYAALGINNIKCSSGWLQRWCTRFGVKLRNADDDELVEWVLEQFEQNLTVTHTDLQIHGMSVVAANNPNFKASAGWSIRFCRRHINLFRQVATVGVSLPLHLEERVEEFRVWIRHVQQQNALMLAAIGCMDEVPLSFAGSIVMEDQKKPQQLIRRTGLENSVAVVCLTILADGGVLPPLVLLKGSQEDLRQEQCDVHISGKLHTFFMDELKISEEVLEKWLDDIWLRHVPSPGILLMDGFKEHLSLRSRMMSNQSVCSGGHDVAIIPSGCSPKLQPLDVHLRTAFMNFVHNAHVHWAQRSVSGMNAQPSPADILEFVNAGYHFICQQQEIVRRSFVVTGITTASDGSQDHLVNDTNWVVAQ